MDNYVSFTPMYILESVSFWRGGGNPLGLINPIPYIKTPSWSLDRSLASAEAQAVMELQISVPWNLEGGPLPVMEL